MKRSKSYTSKAQKHRSSSVKANKNANHNEHFEQFRNDYDIFLDVELNKNNFSLRSFAMGGMPYFEMARISYETNNSLNHKPNGKNVPQVIQDIIAGKLTPMVTDLFKGINIQGKGIPCFISDSRKSITARYMLTLIDPKSNNKSVLPTSRSTEISKASIYSSSMSENKSSNDKENGFRKQKNDENLINFKVVHTRKSSDVSTVFNDFDELNCS